MLSTILIEKMDSRLRGNDREVDAKNSVIPAKTGIHSSANSCNYSIQLFFRRRKLTPRRESYLRR